MENQNRVLAFWMRVLAGLIAVFGVALVFIPAAVVARTPALLVWQGLSVCLGACAALLGLASMLRRKAEVPPEVHATLSRLQHQSMEIQGKLNDLMIMSDRAGRVTQAASHEPKDYTEALEHLGNAIAELRELSLLPDADRRIRADTNRQMHKAGLINELFGLVAAAEWARAERLLISLETEFPNDSEVAKGRNYLEHARQLVEAQTVRRAVREIEDLMLSASWPKAWEKIGDLVDGFPTNAESKMLKQRMEREYEAYCDSATQRMFENIRRHIDQRNWRNALGEAEKLIAQFPSHRLAENLKYQMRTLRENAEIQERQELEVRIQELLNDSQFGQAIELAEDVIRRFPESPQADSLETLLPKIRDLAGEHAFAGGVGQ